MSRVKRFDKHKGARSELLACAWLLAQGYEVFRNVSSCGLVDIIALKDGRATLFDVKTWSLPDHFPLRLTPAQKHAGVKLIAVKPDGECEIDPKEARTRAEIRALRAKLLTEPMVHPKEDDLPLKECAYPPCGKSFKSAYLSKLYCSSWCRSFAAQDRNSANELERVAHSLHDSTSHKFLSQRRRILKGR